VAVVVFFRVRLVPGHQVPSRAATARGPGGASRPAPAVAVKVDETAALVGAKAIRDAARGDGGRVSLRVAHVPERVQVGLLTTGDHDAHGHASADGDNDGLVARRAGIANLVRAVAARLPIERPMAAGRSDRLAVDKEGGVVNGECKGGLGGREKRQDVIGARVHELAVACPRAVGQRLARRDGAEELVIPADVLSRVVLCLTAGLEVAQNTTRQPDEGGSGQSKPRHVVAWGSCTRLISSGDTGTMLKEIITRSEV
jgi:hypothetical protein